MKVKAVKALALFVTIALLLPLFPRTASADGGSVATPQIAVGYYYNSEAASAYYCVAVLKSNGTWMWGNSGNTLPYMVQGPGGTGVLSGVVSLKGNIDGFLALKSDGTVWGWGYNGNGALGSGNKLSQPYPARVKDLTDSTGYLTEVTAISCGGYSSPNTYALALKSDGTVWSWGANFYGQLGVNNNDSNAIFTTAQQVHGTNNAGYLTDVTAIAAGWGSSMALLSDGTVWTWGRYPGDGTAPAKYTPVQVVGEGGSGFLTGVTAMSGSTIASMTAATAGFKYFTVNISPVQNHAGSERVVFVQMRGGVQLAVNASAADFDKVDTAKTGFNVQTGDIIRAYIVDNLTGDEDANPELLQ